ncbi:srp receptor beta subunit [Niveomyces insectorum RCEF 264]|uniref:Signal recognition particle receptor subunit beta n=1 Tax=Niveomyces insectorum RCEF 264 TaxID=1081102 RepID=A0A167RVH1_9HYPO|nr:srp receptor beta subunit [Niveomyces insectorum RCEF 264]
MDVDLAERARLFFAWILTPSAPVFVLGLAVVLLAPVLLHLYLARSAAYITLPSVFVVGPAGAGKTALVTLLERRSTEPAATHTSQVSHAVELAVRADNSGGDGDGGRRQRQSDTYRTDLDAAGATAKKFLLVDTPGHGKLRGATLARLARAGRIGKAGKGGGAGDVGGGTGGGGSASDGNLKAIVFMVDAAALTEPEAGSTTASAAPYLYDLLLSLQKARVSSSSSASSTSMPDLPILVAANKADLFTALPAPRVQSYLEAELGRLRATRSKGLLDSSVGADEVGADGVADESETWLGAYGTERFAFDQLREFGIAVDVVGGNVVGEGPGVDKWWSWLADKI